MRRAVLLVAAICCLAAPPVFAADNINPQADFKAFRDYFTHRFPKVPLDDFVNGPYSIDAGLRKQWKEIDAFPPYQFAVDKGKQMFATPFANGKTYGDCFADKGIGIRQNYPYFDAKSGQVITLDVALNQCREANGEKPFDYTKDDMAALTAYMAYTSRGKPFDIKIPDDPRALAAYEKGEQYFYTRLSAYNFSCASCHVQSPGKHIRSEVLAPALGIVAAMPIYRSNWGGMGTMSCRLRTCNSQIGEEPLKAEDELYRDVRIFSLLHEQRPADFRAGHTPVTATQAGPRPLDGPKRRTKMRTRIFIRLAIMLTIGGLATAALGASADDFKAAYAKAEAASKQAVALKNQWTTTVSALKDAQAAAAAGNYDQAVKDAERAQALANASIAQSKEQATVWKQAVVH